MTVKEKEEKRLQVKLPYELHKEFKAQCAAHDTEMTIVINQLINDWLDEQSKSKK